MARRINRLSALAVANAKRRGMYADGGGLYLQVTPSGSKNWVFRFAANGKTRDMGLGALNVLSLSQAREAAADCRRLRQQGVNPSEGRQTRRTTAQLDGPGSMS